MMTDPDSRLAWWVNFAVNAVLVGVVGIAAWIFLTFGLSLVETGR